MTINQATDYAFRAILYLANKSKGTMVEAQVISQDEVIPMRFLLKIMPSLIRAGIVKSQRGVGGGYYLVKEPGEITFFDVVDAIEGPIHINRCLKDMDACSKKGAPQCKIHQSLAEIQDSLVVQLKKYNFGDLVQQ